VHQKGPQDARDETAPRVARRGRCRAGRRELVDQSAEERELLFLLLDDADDLADGFDDLARLFLRLELGVLERELGSAERAGEGADFVGARRRL
jgi:hypothetical protein